MLDVSLAQRSTRVDSSASKRDFSLSSGFTHLSWPKTSHQAEQTLHQQTLRNVGWLKNVETQPGAINPQQNCSTLATHPQNPWGSTGHAGCFPGLRTAKNSEFFGRKPWRGPSRSK